MEDVGDWKNSQEVLSELTKNPLFQDDPVINDLIGYADEIQPSYYGGEMSWRDSPENREVLDGIRNHLQSKGFDTVKYLNQVENAYGSDAGLTETATKSRDLLFKKINEIQKVAHSRGPDINSVPDPSAPNFQEKMDAFLNGKPSYTDAETVELDKLRADARFIGSAPESQADPNSYISLDPDRNVRSRFAKFESERGSLLSSNPIATAAAGAGGLLAMTSSEDADAGVVGSGTKVVRSLLDMDKPSRMARAKEQGYSWANPLEIEAQSYSTEVITNGSREAVKFSKYLSEKGIPHKSHKAKTGSTYITLEGNPYTTNKGTISLGDLEYRFSNHSKDQYKKILNNQKVDNTFEADVFPNGHTLEDAIRKVESTPGIRSVDAAFDPAKISSSNLLASNPVATTSAALLANGGQPSNLLSYMQGKTDAYLTNEERQYLQNKQAFESNFSNDTGWDRADILPFRVNEQTGEREFATPEMIKGLLSGLYDIGQSKNTKISNPASLLELI
jgi:hypothetical protein